MKANLRRARFTIEAFPGEIFDGYSNDEEWNGWACPYFTFEEAVKIADAHEKTLNVKATRKEAEDKFIFDFPDETEEYAAVLIEGRKLYPLGNCCWIWEEIES